MTDSLPQPTPAEKARHRRGCMQVSWLLAIMGFIGLIPVMSMRVLVSVFMITASTYIWMEFVHDR